MLRTRVGAFPGELAALYCFNPWLGACFGDAIGGKRTDARGHTAPPLLISPSLAARVMGIQVALGGKSNGVVRPSTGLIGVGLALASCARVSLFGFANDSDKSALAQSQCNHYYDCRFNQTRYFSGRMGYHDWHGQWRVLSALVELGALEYHAPLGAASAAGPATAEAAASTDTATPVATVAAAAMAVVTPGGSHSRVGRTVKGSRVKKVVKASVRQVAHRNGTARSGGEVRHRNATSRLEGRAAAKGSPIPHHARHHAHVVGIAKSSKGRGRSAGSATVDLQLE